MKTFEEKWTAWLDGQLTGRELSEFEASLPDKAAAVTEKADARKLGALLKREITAHGSPSGVLNLCCRSDYQRGAAVTRRRNGLERTCYGGKCRAAATDSAGIDSDRGVPEEIFRLQPISGDWPVAKDTQDGTG